MIKCPYCNDENPDGAVVCGSCGHKFSNQAEQAKEEYRIYDPTLHYPMKWYKFLIYFDLIAGFILNCFIGLGRVTGFYLYFMYNDRYFDYMQGMQKQVPYMRWVDVISGLVIIGIAVLMLITRKSLREYKKNGPLLLNLTYLSVIVVGIVFIVVYALISNQMSGSFKYDIRLTLVNQGFNCVTSIIIWLCNLVYFNKRKDLFVN